MTAIKINDGSIYTNTQNVSDKLDILEDSLAELFSKIENYKEKLTGEGYSGFFKSVDDEIEAQKQMIAAYRVLLSDVHSYATDMVNAEIGVNFL